MDSTRYKPYVQSKYYLLCNRQDEAAKQSEVRQALATAYPWMLPSPVGSGHVVALSCDIDICLCRSLGTFSFSCSSSYNIYLIPISFLDCSAVLTRHVFNIKH